MDYSKEYKQFIDTWGIEAQSRMAIEEMSELTKELCKIERHKGKEKKCNKIKDNIIEEIADVLICVEQLELYYGKEAVAKAKQEKIQRTLSRL